MEKPGEVTAWSGRLVTHISGRGRGIGMGWKQHGFVGGLVQRSQPDLHHHPRAWELCKALAGVGVGRGQVLTCLPCWRISGSLMT